MIHIAFVEDEPLVRDQLISYLHQYEKESGEHFEVTCFLDGDEIVDEYKASYDIIFLDIQMKRMDGMVAAEKIRALDPDVIIIFITNMANYAIRGYAVDAMDFILKPIPYFAFSQQLQKAVSRVQQNSSHSILIPVESGIVKLNTAKILYIESISRRLMVHTKEQTYIVYSTLKEMEEKLKEDYFYRCNNCYLINLAYVERVKQNVVTVGGVELQISRPRKKAFMNALADYVGGVIR